MSDKEKINAAFRKLRARGYVARQNFMCCMRCGMAAIPERTEKWVFYHQQDRDSGFVEVRPWQRNRKRELLPEISKHGLHIRWGGDADEIIAAFESVDLRAEWSGSKDHTILVRGAILEATL